MASAWEQAAEIQPVNQRLRQLQVSMAVGESLHARHLSPLSEEMTLRFASPVFSRHSRADARARSGGTHADGDDGGHVAAGPGDAHRDAAHRQAARAVHAAHRRAGGRRGRSRTTWVARLNLDIASGRSSAAPTIVQAGVPPLPTVDAVVGAIWNSGFVVAAENQPLPPLPAVDPLPPGWDYPGHFRKAAAEHLSRARARASSASFIPHITMSDDGRRRARADASRAWRWRISRARAISTGDNVLPPTAPGVTPVGTETVMMAPSFPQPMYEALKEKSQELLLPGLDKVAAGHRARAQDQPRVRRGLHGRPQRRDGARAAVARLPDRSAGHVLQALLGHRCGAAARGQRHRRPAQEPGAGARHGAADSPANQFVLLLRSSLLRRYPNAIIYLTPAVTGAATTPPPPTSIRSSTARWSPTSPSSASRSRQPRRSARPRQPGLLRRHPGASDRAALRSRWRRSPRRCWPTKSHLPIGTQPPAGVPLKGRTWGRNSAHMADITRRLPVRITIHASQLVSLT